MPADGYPRNVVPLSTDALRALSHSASLSLYLAACERPVRAEHLVRVTGRAYDEALARAMELVACGLLKLEAGTFVIGPRHVREEDLDEPGKIAFRLGLVAAAAGVVDDAKRAFRISRQSAKAGIAMVTLPDRHDVLTRAIAIITEAEDQLRALAEEAGDGGPRVRITFFTHSLPPPTFSEAATPR